MNYFAYPSAAERYAHGRPYFHPLVMERIAAVCGRVERALDVGCGTGLSTVALAEIADEVVGADVSRDMLDQASAHRRISYVEGPAEALPLAAGSFDLITVGLAFHWFDRERFLVEARRLLRPDGWLVVYNDGHEGSMIGNDAYARWNREEYVRRYPTPPRNPGSPGADEALRHGFVLVGREQFTHNVAFTIDELTRYLLTQSNVIAAVEAGTEDIQSIAGWIAGSLRPVFKAEAAEFPFHCTVVFFRLTNPG